MKKIGLLGAGYIAQNHVEAWHRLENVRIATVCDKNEVKAKIIAEKSNAQVVTNLEDLLNSGIDALDVCLPTKFHFEAVMAAMSSKIPVLCEKPMALTYDSAEVMVHTAESNNIPFMIGFCLRFDPNYAYFKKVMKKQAYGKLKSLRLFRNSAIPFYSESQWLLDANLSGGVALDLHIHDVDLIYWLLGTPEWVFTRANPASIGTSYGYQDIVVSTEATWRAHRSYPYSAGFDAQFEQASLVLKDGELKLYTESEEKIIRNVMQELSAPEITGSDLYQNEISYFNYCLNNHLKPEYCLPGDSLNAHRILMLELESAKSGKKIKF